MKSAIATLAVLVSSAALGSPDATSVAAQNGTRATDGTTSETIGSGTDKVICKRDKVSGSRVAAKRVCQTAAEWERQRRADQQAIEKIQNSNSKS